MKKAFSFILFVCLMIGLSQAQTAKWELYELNAAAELVVTGKVSLLEGKNLTLAIDQVVAGSYSEKTIVVKRFVNTKTAKRWGKYVQGEELMLWLQQVEGVWQIVGENGEGEKLLFNGEVYLDSRGGGLKNSFGNHAPYPQLSIYAEKVKAEELIAAVKDTRDCFGLDIVEAKSPEGEVMYKRFAVKKLEDKQYDDIRGRGWMQELLVANGEKHLR